MNFFDSILSYFGFSIGVSTTAEQFAYAAAIAFLIALLFLIFNLLFKLYYRENFWTCGTTMLLVIVAMSLVVYWVSLKIPSSVEAFWAVLHPNM